jgi:O-antigen/teichoic acid export membrane protein
MENRSDDPQAIPFGKHITISIIPVEIRQHYDRIIIGLFLSFPELAIYAIALGFANILSSFSSIIAQLIFPKLSQMDQETAYLEVKKRWPLLILAFGIVAGVAIALCPYIILFFYSSQYVDSVFYAQLLLVSVIIAAPVPIINKALFPSQKKMNELYKLRIFSSVIEIILLTVLALRFGLLGAVIAVILGQAFTAFYSLKLARFIFSR